MVVMMYVGQQGWVFVVVFGIGVAWGLDHRL